MAKYGTLYLAKEMTYRHDMNPDVANPNEVETGRTVYLVNDTKLAKYFLEKGIYTFVQKMTKDGWKVDNVRGSEEITTNGYKQVDMFNGDKRLSYVWEISTVEKPVF